MFHTRPPLRAMKIRVAQTVTISRAQEWMNKRLTGLNLSMFRTGACQELLFFSMHGLSAPKGFEDVWCKATADHTAGRFAQEEVTKLTQCVDVALIFADIHNEDH